MHPAVSVQKRSFATARVVFALVVREMVTTYGRSPGGYIWAVLEPVAAIMLLSLAFSFAFHAPVLGASFPLFYATGYLPYMLFHDITSKTSTAIRFSRPLLNFSAVTWLDVIVARFVLNALTHLMVFGVVIGGLLVLLHHQSMPELASVINALAMAAVLALGMGSLNAYLFLAFPAWERVWTVLTRPLFLVSGIFFLYEDLPNWAQQILWFNPLVHITAEMHKGFYATYLAEFRSAPFVYGVGIALLTLGMMLLSRHHDDLINK